MNEESVVVRSGLTVTKSFSAEEFPVPAVTFEVASTRDEPVELRITDAIPEGFGVEQIGFHPDYGSEHWTATGDGEVRFERTVEPKEQFTTVYGVRMSTEDEPTVFLEKPTVEVDPKADVETERDVVPEESSAVVRELARGDRETVPGLETGEPVTEVEGETEDVVETEPQAAAGIEEPESDDAVSASESDDAVSASELDAVSESISDEAGSEAESVEPVEAESGEPMAESGKSDAAGDDEAASEEDVQDELMTARADQSAKKDVEGETDSGSPPDSVEEPTEEAPSETDIPSEPTPERIMPPETDTESIVAAFAAEIEAGTIEQEDLAVIREAVIDERPSDRVRLEHLQSRVSDLEAYSDALESFLDENGTGQEVLSEIESDIGQFDDELGRIGDRLDAAAAERDTMSEHLESLEDTVEAIAGVAEQIERLRGDLEAAEERLDDVDGVRMEFAALKDQVESIQEDVTEVTEWRNQLSDVFG